VANNAASTITISGSYGLTLTIGEATGVTLPASGTLINSTDTAAKATELATSRTIGGVAFNGTANISVLSATGGFTVSGGNLVLSDQHITGAGRISFTQELDNGSKTANFSVDFATDQKQKCTLTANVITLTLDTTSVGVGNYLLKIVNGGLATLTWASESGAIYFPSGTDPDLTSSGTDIVAAYFDGTNWYLMASLDFS